MQNLQYDLYSKHYPTETETHFNADHIKFVTLDKCIELNKKPHSIVEHLSYTDSQVSQP